MNYKTFQTSVSKELRRKTGEDVRLCENTKNNGVVRVGVAIGVGEVSPVIYLEEFFDDYQQKSHSIEKIAGEIVRLHNECKDVPFNGQEILKHLGKGENVICKLIHTGSNLELLQKVPHKAFLDLSVIYYLDVGETQDTGERMTILITDEMLGVLPFSEETLYELATKNMREKFGHRFCTMYEMVGELLMGDAGNPLTEESRDGDHMYVLTNTQKFWGATVILQFQILEEIGERLQQDFYIIPSSIQEVLIVPSDIGITEEDMNLIIQEINETHVSEEERLSDHVYHYSVEERKISG